jgi:hypothetical protein
VTIEHFCAESPNPIKCLQYARRTDIGPAVRLFGLRSISVPGYRLVFIFAPQSTEQLPPSSIFDYSGLKGKKKSYWLIPLGALSDQIKTILVGPYRIS